MPMITTKFIEGVSSETKKHIYLGFPAIFIVSFFQKSGTMLLTLDPIVFVSAGNLKNLKMKSHFLSA